MSIRHEKVDQLERLLKENGGSGIAIHIEHKMTGLPTVDFYQSLDNLLVQKKKMGNSTIKCSPGQVIPIYMTTINEEKFVFHSN